MFQFSSERIVAHRGVIRTRNKAIQDDRLDRGLPIISIARMNVIELRYVSQKTGAVNDKSQKDQEMDIMRVLINYF